MPVGHQAYCVRVKRFVGKEKPKLLELCGHENVLLLGVYGADARRDRLIGYAMVFAGAPIIHRITKYCTFSYSEPTEIKHREVRVIYDDEFVRLLRFGMGVFDYMLVCRKSTDEQLQVEVADLASHIRFSGSWKDGM